MFCAVLCAPPRGGRRHAKAVGAYTLDRLHRWQEGERQTLWDTRPATRAWRASALTPAEKRDLAAHLGRAGHDRKACAALLSQGLRAVNTSNAQALAALHPSSPPPTVDPIEQLPLAAEIVPDLVARCLSSFPVDTAPGPTGLRAQHLRDGCVAGGRDSLLTQLTAVVQLLAHGRAPAHLAPILAGAGLVALPKPSGGVRRIAVGEIVRRLTAKCLMSLVREEAGQFFWPCQVGVATPNGAEAAIHTVRAWTRRNRGSSKVLLKLDFRNAFNTIDRSTVLREACGNFPTLARWVVWCYRQPGRLQFGGHVVDSCQGVQQGDPLGPLLFSAGLHPVARRLQQRGLDLALFYLDDGLLAGDVGAVATALRLLQREAAAIGLSLNLSKSELISLAPDDMATLLTHFPDTLLRGSDGNPRVLHNFDFLGAAIGEDSFISSHTADRAAKAGDLLDALGELEDPQVALRILRVCGGFARMVHSMRCNPAHAQSAGLAMFDGMVRRCFSDFTGLHPTSSQWQQAARGFAHAGLGLRSTHTHSSAAFLASIGSCLEQCCTLDAGFNVDEAKASPDLQAALAALNADLPADKNFSLDDALGRKQRDLSRALDEAGWAAHLGHVLVATAFWTPSVIMPPSALLVGSGFSAMKL